MAQRVNDFVGGKNCIAEGHPVDVVSGTVFTEQTDFTLYGAQPFTWGRFYNSKALPLPGDVLHHGPGWRHPLDEVLLADTDAEVELVMEHCKALGVQVALSSHWANGGAGATDLAHMVAEICEADSVSANSPHKSFVYPNELSLWEKLETVATIRPQPALDDVQATVRVLDPRQEQHGQ